MTDRQRNGFILLLVLGLLAASFAAILTQKTVLGLDLKGGIELVYQGKPTAQTKVVTQDALSRAVDIMRERVDQLGVSQPLIQTTGNSLITVGLPDVSDVSRAEKIVGKTARLEFYDWEANALTPNGKTVASQLQTQDPSAVTISQGSGSVPPGDPGGGSLSLYDAVKLASKQPAQVSADNARLGSQYYLFGAPGSAACAALAKDQGKTPSPGVHCLLAGPDDNQSDLLSALPKGVSASEGQQLVVPPGTVVLQASDPNASKQTNPNDPNAQFYVLKDHVSLFGNEITNPQQSTDQSGNPDVTFSFNSKGGKAFESVTGTIAHRGDLVSGLGNTFNQHFAVALDNKLITVPQIDFKTYPDGITGGQGADITGGFTINSAQDLATQLRLGALPINLSLISESQVSATLGKQALHQGLIAGLAGLLIVMIFLIAYYRVLGVIATVGLIVYGIYFFALIKLIPITLTLPGIAGLILTIGVAADANIVIFERVKEEIRAGRSIRQGIITGYKKGLTAIIDANVVTIMTAFILFVLATADVKGFAFTLGIGTIVSLFTAVLATQAILMTMGNSRVISHPSALGAAGKTRRVRFDFMGASRYFFSMSGVILLIGALAIGGKGLNLGIDFTSGSRITAGLVRPSTENQIRSIADAAGAANPVVQKVSGDSALGKNGFQISAKKMSQKTVSSVRNTLQQRYGLQGVPIDVRWTDVRKNRRQQRRRRDHRLTAGDLRLRRAAVRVEVRRPRPDRPDARPADHQRRLCADRPGGDDSDSGRAADDFGLFPVRHDHRVRPDTRKRAADAARRVHADRQPLDVRGADPVVGHDLVHADADHRAAAVRRGDAEGLRVRAADRRRLRRLFVDLHRLAGPVPLEGARGSLPLPPGADRGRVRRGSGVRGR